MEPPDIKWDIELRLGKLHMPDWLEDSLPTWIINKVLKGFDVKHEIELDVDVVELIREAGTEPESDTKPQGDNKFCTTCGKPVGITNKCCRECGAAIN